MDVAQERRRSQYRRVRAAGASEEIKNVIELHERFMNVSESIARSSLNL
jgi:hypothetical protein